VPTEIERLYREHHAGLVRLVERELHDHHEAEDVVQTAFLAAQRAIERGTVPRNPRAWLAAIALNAARRLRGRRLNAEPLEDYAIQEASGVAEIRAALTSLPRQQQAAVLYRDVLGLSYDETAAQMGTSVNAVTMLLHRGRQRLRDTLGVSTGGVSLWRWLNQSGTQQAAVVKGAAAAVAVAGLATGGFVAADRATRAVAPRTADTTVALPALQSGSGPAAGAGEPQAGTLARASTAPRFTATGGSTGSPVPVQGAGGAATRPTATGAAASALSTLVRPAPSVPLPTLSVPTLPAGVTVTTPVAAVTVTVPTGTTATVTTPVTTVTVPIP
jgi:RNA polymerase sigma factor (sigma-70 family)